jgi:hypothetical protein
MDPVRSVDEVVIFDRPSLSRRSGIRLGLLSDASG